MVSLKELKDAKMTIFHCPWLLHLNTFMASCFLGLWVRRVKQVIQGLGCDEHSDRSKWFWRCSHASILLNNTQTSDIPERLMFHNPSGWSF
jgi:hypothetical protein